VEKHTEEDLGDPKKERTYPVVTKIAATSSFMSLQPTMARLACSSMGLGYYLAMEALTLKKLSSSTIYLPRSLRY